MGQDAPRSAQAAGSRNAIPQFECPDTIVASWDYPGFTMLYHGALSGSLDGGNIIFRGHRATMKLNCDGLAVYEEGKVRREITIWPPPEFAVESHGDGTIAHYAELPRLHAFPQGAQRQHQEFRSRCPRRAPGQRCVTVQGLSGKPANMSTGEAKSPDCSPPRRSDSAAHPEQTQTLTDESAPRFRTI